MKVPSAAVLSPLRRPWSAPGCLLILALALAAGSRGADAPYPWPAVPQYQPLSLERIAARPAAEQPAWRAYWQASQDLLATLPPREAFVPPPTQRLEGAGIPGKHSRGLRLEAPEAWYAEEPARAVADRVVARQTRAGGWTKGNDYSRPEGEHAGAGDVWSAGTFDNDATTWELRFLARVAAANAGSPRAAAWREAVLRGLRYVLAAQYPHGGFPQIYPLAGGYHDAVTFNDDAMVQALELLRDLRDGRPEFGFVPAALRAEAGPRVERGLRCILATQLRDPTGRPTVWCQQHDAVTLRACAARNFEPAALCTNESASLLRFLLAIPEPAPEVVAAVRGAAAWFERTALRDLAWTREGGVGRLVARPGAPLLWARMYEFRTDKPIFGDRDRTVHYDVAELSSERRNGYAWYGTWPAAALEQFRLWRERHP